MSGFWCSVDGLLGVRLEALVDVSVEVSEVDAADRFAADGAGESWLSHKE